MKKFLPALLLLLLPFILPAQNGESWKIPLSLYEKASHFSPTTMMGILVEGNPIEVAEAAKKHGGFFRYAQGTICSIAIPAGKLVPFSKEPGVIRIGNAPVKLQPLNDTMKVLTRVNDVHNGLAPLTQSYKGDNIIMGMIDSGIDFNHPDFKDSLGHTRILYIWDQRDQTGPGPSPWAYGTLWDSAQINAGTCTHNDLQYYGHGTHVSGIAAGNGRSTNARDYSGVAPNANYIMVALDFNGAYSAVAVADAAAYIYNTAQSLGRPCVINASVGDYSGSHDGQDLQALMIDSLLDTPSRAFVCAAGNAGNEPIHLSYSLSSDTNFTWFVSSGYNVYIQLWADTNNFNAAKMAIGCTQESNFANRGRTGFSTIQSNLLVYNTDTIRNSSGQEMAKVVRYGSTQGSAYSMEFLIQPDSIVGYDYSLQLTGSGAFHCWSFDMHDNSTLPTASAYPQMVYYKAPDTTYTLCSSFQCSSRTITVANYVNRGKWLDYDTLWQTDNTVVPSDIMYNSSVGPTRDGRVKPDIAAPGANILSCGVISTLPGIIASSPQYVGVGGFHLVGGGTSAASPVVAGCAALWMQQFPNATWSDVKNAVIFCAKTDSFTGTNLPDPTWGYGKVDAFSMMTNCALTTHDNSVSAENNLQLFPNPVINGQSFQLNVNGNSAVQQLEIYASNGQLVYSQQIAPGQSTVMVNAALNSGMYLVRVSSVNSSETKKLIVE